MLEARKISFTGSSAAASALAMNKSKSKDAVRPRGALMAKQLVFVPKDVGAGKSLIEFQKSVGELVIKPASEGSSAGLAFIKNTAECDSWYEKNKSSGSTWLAEERIYGRELTVGVMTHKGCLTVLPPSEVILERNANFDYQAKYHGVGNKEITPAVLTLAQATAAQELSILAHTAIGCFGYTRTDMIMTPKGMYYLETNTLPGMTKASFIPQQLAAAGVGVRDFVAGQLELAKRRYE
jgi:D-alanine-D-alanine ligase